jgi:hypothetical protein
MRRKFDVSRTGRLLLTAFALFGCIWVVAESWPRSTLWSTKGVDADQIRLIRDVLSTFENRQGFDQRHLEKVVVQPFEHRTLSKAFPDLSSVKVFATFRAFPVWVRWRHSGFLTPARGRCVIDKHMNAIYFINQDGDDTSEFVRLLTAKGTVIKSNEDAELVYEVYSALKGFPFTAGAVKRVDDETWVVEESYLDTHISGLVLQIDSTGRVTAFRHFWSRKDDEKQKGVRNL